MNSYLRGHWGSIVSMHQVLALCALVRRLRVPMNLGGVVSELAGGVVLVSPR